MPSNVPSGLNTGAYRAGSIGAAISALSLVAMAFIVLPAGLAYPGLQVLTGSLNLSSADKTDFLGGMRVLFILDGIFLLGWMLAWTGLAALVGSRDHLRGILVLAFGLAGALFDLGENGIILGALQSLEAGNAATGGWTIAWKAVQHLSYWLPFAGALLASGIVWSFGWPGRFTPLPVRSFCRQPSRACTCPDFPWHPTYGSSCGF